MLQSMTGFGRGEAVNEDFRVVVEIKSVNNRFKDFRFKMSNLLNPLESKFKETISEQLKRGSFEIIVNYKKIKSSDHLFNLDKDKIANFVKKIKDIEKINQCEISYKASDFLKVEFQEDIDSDNLFSMLEPTVMSAFEVAAKNINEARSTEGRKIKQVLLAYVENYKKELSKIIAKRSVKIILK